MAFHDAYIPVHFSWSSPVRPLAGPAGGAPASTWPWRSPPALADRGLPISEATRVVFGWTVPQPEIFYGGSTLAARIGAPRASARCCPRPARLGRLLGGGGAAGRRRTGRTVAGDHHRPHLQRPGPDLAGAVGRPAGRPGRSTGCSTASGVTRGAGWRWSPRSGMGRRRAPTHSVQIGLAILWQMVVRSSRVSDRLGTGPCLTCRLWVEPPAGI